MTNTPMTNDAERVSDIVARWKLVPVNITLEMQKAYFDVIDKNLPRVEKDMRFGRFDSNREAYRAMIAAAPKSETADIIEAQSKALAEAREIIKAARAAFKAEYHEDGRVLSVGYDSEALRPLIATLDAALTPTPENPNG